MEAHLARAGNREDGDRDYGLAQFIDGFPLLGAWLICRGTDSVRQQAIAPAEAVSQSNAAARTYLESEAWLPDYDPGPQLQEIALPVPGSHAYLCGLGTTGLSYLLLWAYESLSPTERSTLEFQVRFMDKYLAVCQQRDRQRQTIHTLEQVLQRVGHQLRQPLSLIQLYAETLCLDLPDGAWRQQTETIRDSARQTCGTLNDILDYGRHRSLQREVCDIHVLLRECLTELQPCLDQKQISLCASQTPATFVGDAAQVKQVLVNLMHNAVCFSPDGGTITCSWTSFAHEVLVEIRDQGPGLSPDDLSKVFTPFYSRRQNGTGLGLAIAKNIILEHRGQLWVDNLPIGGAQFSFVLPRQRDDAGSRLGQ